MLSLERPLVVDGITVYRDHADPSRFWYLPGRVSLAKRSDGGPAVSLISYRAAEAAGVAQGGGYMMFEATLELPRSTLGKIESRVSSEPGVVLPVSIAPPPFENGSVQCIALDLQGSGGTEATAAPAGAFRATEEILGASVPTMDAANRAAFNLVLSQQGAIIMEQALREGLTPVGVVYSLQYLALRPALDVTITAQLDQVFTHLSAGLEGQYMFFKAGIEAAMEFLRSKGVIDIVVNNFTDEADEKEQEKWALQLFTDTLLADWFKPTLAPGKLAGGAVPTPTGGVPTPTGGVPTPTGGAPTPTGGAPTPTGGAPTPTGGAPTPTGGVPTPTGGGTVPTPGGAPTGNPAPMPRPPAAPQLATLVPEASSPNPLPTGLSVTHTPAPTGTTETLRVTGAGARVRLAGQEVTLASDGTVTRPVNAGESVRVEVSWPPPTAATAATGETFCLFFDMDKPAEAGWSTQPPNQEFRSYVENSTTDPRFRQATGIQQVDGDGAWTGPEVGAERLRRWIAQLPAPRQVEVRGYASHEHATPQSDPVRAAYNMRLSRRRLDVAVALVRRAGGDPVVQEALGDTVAAERPGSHSHFGGDPDNRVAQIKVSSATSGSTSGTVPTWSGVLRRGTAPGPGTTSGTPGTTTGTPGTTTGTPGTTTGTPGTTTGTPGTTTGTPGTTTGTPGTTTGTPGTTTGTPGTTTSVPNPSQVTNPPTVAAFKLRFIRQEERRTLTLRYQRTEAVRRTLAPQGFVGLMADALDEADKVITLVDLDHPFFRELEVVASMPGDVSDLGLTAAQLAIDYGPPGDITHADLEFDEQDRGPKSFRTFLDDKLTMSYDARLDLGFDGSAGWEGDALSYSIPKPDSTDRNVVINPHEYVDLRTITIEPGNIDWEIVQSIDVRLVATGYGDRDLRHLVTLTSDTTPQVWRLRGALPAPEPRGVSVSLVQTLTDGTVERTEPAPVDLSLVRVDDLFTDALELMLVPSFAGTGADRVIVDVTYDDPANDYHRALRHELPATTTEPLRLRIALRDPTLRTYRVRFTFTGPNLFDQRAFVETTEEVLPIR